MNFEIPGIFAKLSAIIQSPTDCFYFVFGEVARIYVSIMFREKKPGTGKNVNIRVTRSKPANITDIVWKMPTFQSPPAKATRPKAKC